MSFDLLLRNAMLHDGCIYGAEPNFLFFIFLVVADDAATPGWLELKKGFAGVEVLNGRERRDEGMD